MRRYEGYSRDDFAECANCGANEPAELLRYDNLAEHYVCDRECFDEWHDSNPERVGDYYYGNNID